MKTRSLLFVSLFLALAAFSGILYSVFIPANPMPLTSPTFSLNSANGFYAKSAVLVFSGTTVTQVQVAVYNSLPYLRTATVTVQVFDWNGNLISSGSTLRFVSGFNVATATVTLSPSVPYSSVAEVRVSVG